MNSNLRSFPIRVHLPGAALLALAILIVPVLQAEDSLAGHALIRRDTAGVPHILAESEEAAAFAHGYVTAEDHLEVLSRLFLRAQGAQASVLGATAVDEDLLVHRLGIPETAHSRFGELPPLMQAILNAYAAGYDLYLSRHPAEAPQWARPVSGVDILAHCRSVLLMDFALDLRPWKRVQTEEKPASNMWAIGRERSHSKHGILLANPHLRWQGSQLFHEVHIQVSGVINIYGAALIGFPVVTIGFNDYLGWTHTINQHHSDDTYELTIDQSDPGTYLYDHRRLPFSVRTVSIEVKSEKGMETRTEKVFISHYGPVISMQGRRAYAYKSANLEIVGFLTQYNLMAKAQDLAAFRAVLNMQQLPMFNIGYADRDGNVFFLGNARIPIRPAGIDWSKPVRGDTAATEWYALHPISDLPQLLNPPGGYIQNCNDPPWYTNLQQVIDKSKYPAYMVYEGLNARSQISLALLEDDKDLTLEKVKHYKNNEVLLTAERMKSDLIELTKSKDLDADSAEALRLLSSWDNTASANEKGAMLFNRWWQEYARANPRVFRMPWDPQHPITTPAGIGNPERAMAALAQAAAAVKKEYGSVAVTWGDIHHLQRGNVDVPIGGDNGLFRTIVYCRENQRLLACGGDSFVLAVEFTNPPTAYSVTAYSESSNPHSAHYNDQAALFAREDYKPVWFSEQDIAKHIERAYHPGE